MSLLYFLPWLLWFLAFVLLEANGFRKAHDRWPTLSQVIKGWEDHKLMFVAVRGATVEERPFPKMVYVADKRGVVNWTWERWVVAAGLPILAIALELHWVLEWPF